MARARLLKPGFFKNEDLAELPPHARLLYAGLWTLADREGLLEDRPRRIGADVFPYEDIDVDGLLSQLEDRQFVIRYVVDGQPIIAIPKFLEHQKPHVREAPSILPAPTLAEPRHNLGNAEATPRRPESVSKTETVTEADPVSGPVPDPVSETETGTRAPRGLLRANKPIVDIAIEALREYPDCNEEELIDTVQYLGRSKNLSIGRPQAIDAIKRAVQGAA